MYTEKVTTAFNDVRLVTWPKHFGFNYMPSPHENLKNNLRATGTNNSTSEIPNNPVIFTYTRRIMLKIFYTIISKHLLT